MVKRVTSNRDSSDTFGNKAYAIVETSNAPDSNANILIKDFNTTDLAYS